MLHLAIKAFYPAPLPFPLLHVDTTWKFREMILFRDETARRLNLDLLVYVNEEGIKQGISPISSGSAIHTHVMKTESLKQALDKFGFDAAFGGARRDEEKSRAKEENFSRSEARTIPGIHAINGRNYGIFSTRELTRGNPFASFRYPTGPSLTFGITSRSRIFELCPYISQRSDRSFSGAEPGSWSMTTGCRSIPENSHRCAAFASAHSDVIR